MNQYKSLWIWVVVSIVISCAHKEEMQFTVRQGDRVLSEKLSEEKQEECWKFLIDHLKSMEGKFSRIAQEIELSKLSKGLWKSAGGCLTGFSGELVDFQAAVLYHESHHLLGTAGEVIRREWGEKEWDYYLDGAPNNRFNVKFYPNTLDASVIFPKIRAYDFLHLKETYFSSPGRGPFYIILDEWNAYAEGLSYYNVQLKRSGSFYVYDKSGKVSKVQTDRGTPPLEFCYYTWIYLEELKKRNLDLWRTLRKDVSIKKFILSLIHRTEEYFREAKKYPSLFSEADMKQLLPQYERANKELKQWAH